MLPLGNRSWRNYFMTLKVESKKKRRGVILCNRRRNDFNSIFRYVGRSSDEFHLVTDKMEMEITANSLFFFP